MKNTFRIIPYEQLTLDEFHDMIALRIKVFIVEQDCPYQELDGLDKKAEQLLAYDKGELSATLRVLPPGVAYDVYSIGRVVVDPRHRGSGLGHEVMEKAIQFIEHKEQSSEIPIKLSAQKHLRKYYESHGFKKCGDGYLEDGIPHIPMLRDLSQE